MKEPNLGDIKDWAMSDDIEQPVDYPKEPEYIIHDGEILENDPWYDYLETSDIFELVKWWIFGLSIVLGFVALAAHFAPSWQLF